MSLEELADRLELFKKTNLIDNINEWRKVVFKSRGVNYHQLIKPDEINIIDYLEITKDPFLIADLIKAIYNKLDKGIAIIAIQKKKGTDEGVGGHYSMFQARLYITMERNKIKITKAKLFKQPGEHMPDKVYGFKLLSGTKFIPWEK